MSSIIVSVVVCTYNRADLLKGCLESLATQAASGYEVVVVDNNSKDKTEDIARSFVERFPSFQYVKETNQGLSHARNRGFKEAKGEYVAYIDDDAKAMPNWIERILAAFETVKPKPVAVGGKIFPWYEDTPPSWFTDDMETRTWGDEKKFLEPPRAQYGFSGSNMVFKKSLLEEFGGFSPDYGVVGNTLRLGEESELFSRIYKKYPFFWYDPDIRVEHWVPVRNFSLVYRFFRMFKGGKASRKIQLESVGVLPALFHVASLISFLFFYFPLRLLKCKDSRKSEAVKMLHELGYRIGFLIG